MKIVGKLTGTRTGRLGLGKGGLSPLYTFRLIRIKCKWAWQQRTLTWIRIERFPGRWQMCPSCSKYPHLSTLPLVTRPGRSGQCVSLSSLVAAGLVWQEICLGHLACVNPPPSQATPGFLVTPCLRHLHQWPCVTWGSVWCGHHLPSLGFLTQIVNHQPLHQSRYGHVKLKSQSIYFHFSSLANK